MANLVDIESSNDILRIKSGGAIDLDAGAQLRIQNSVVNASAADHNLLTGMSAAAENVTHVAKVALAAVDTGGGVFSWANPQAVSIVVLKVVVNVTTAATGACSLDIGTTSSSGTTQADTVIDGLDVHTGTGVFDTSDQVGANGKSRNLLASGKWVTASKDSGASSGLVGFAYIHYQLV